MKADSPLASVAALQPGESYAQAKFIPAFVVTPDRIRRAKRRLANTMTVLLSRAKERTGANDYRMHSFHTYTQSYDTLVVGVITRETDI